jgi:hypothetical protein
MTKTGLTPFESFSIMNSNILLCIQDSLSNAESAIINIANENGDGDICKQMCETCRSIICIFTAPFNEMRNHIERFSSRHSQPPRES